MIATDDAFPKAETLQQFCLDAYGEAYDELVNLKRIDPDVVSDKPSLQACTLVCSKSMLIPELRRLFSLYEFVDVTSWLSVPRNCVVRGIQKYHAMLWI